MPAFTLRLFTDRLSANATTDPLPAMSRAVYVWQGDAVLHDDGGGHDFGTNEARFSAGPITLRAGGAGATLLRWDLAPKHRAGDGAATGAGVTSTPTFGRDVALHPWTAFMMRCDRVDFPAGGQALTHIHPGPGVRCVVQGRISVRTHGRDSALDKGQGWFELGPEPVFAQASPDEATGFVRVMLLPRALRGRNSIHYVNPDDLAKPKSQSYTRFFDADIEL